MQDLTLYAVRPVHQYAALRRYSLLCTGQSLKARLVLTSRRAIEMGTKEPVGAGMALGQELLCRHAKAYVSQSYCSTLLYRR